MLRNDRIAEVAAEAVAWRHRLHAAPELGFREIATAAFVAEKLREFGLEVWTDVSATAVVGLIRAGTSQRRIAFRAELDALPIVERSGVPYASGTEGVMHACGHDGHMAMLLGAAKLLAADPQFDGTIVLVFQPAEEVLGGGKKLVEDGILARFPVDAVYAVHNWPGLPLGTIAVREGAMMASVDDFTVTFHGAGCHAAMPHLGDDPLLAAAEFTTSLQRIVSRAVDPQSALVVSVTQIHGGSFNNFVPTTAEVQGTCRFFAPAYSALCRDRLTAIAEGVAKAHGLACSIDYRVGYPPVINSVPGAALAAEAARRAVGADRIRTSFQPSMGCEDFAFLLGAVGNGAYAWIGAGDHGPGQGLHGDRYVFADEIIETGLRYWTELATIALPRQA